MAGAQFSVLPCALAGVQAMVCETRHVFARHTHEQFGIGLVDRGAQRSTSGRGMVEAGSGDTITVNPGEVHDGAPIGDAARAWRIIYFEPEIIAAALDETGEGGARGSELRHPVISRRDVSRHVHRLFTALTQERSPGLASEERLLSLLPALMQERRGCEAGRGTPLAIARARALIDDDPAAPLSLGELARASELSRFQLLRGFARATGLTPHAYLVQRRIDLARRLIARGTKLAEAAAAGGFADQSHMTRVFVRKYGLSPGAYAAAR